MSDDRPIEQPSDPTAPAPEPTSSPADATQSLAQTTPRRPRLSLSGHRPTPLPARPRHRRLPVHWIRCRHHPGAARGIPRRPTRRRPTNRLSTRRLGQQAYPPPPPSAYPQYGVPPVGYAAPQQTNVSGLVLTIISGLLVFSCYFT